MVGFFVGMTVAMETYRDIRLILWCAVPVTNDMPRALFPNIDTARNNIAGFSQMKSRGEKNTPEAILYVHVLKHIMAGFSCSPPLTAHTFF